MYVNRLSAQKDEQIIPGSKHLDGVVREMLGFDRFREQMLEPAQEILSALQELFESDSGDLELHAFLSRVDGIAQRVAQRYEEEFTASAGAGQTQGILDRRTILTTLLLTAFSSTQDTMLKKALHDIYFILVSSDGPSRLKHVQSMLSHHGQENPDAGSDSQIQRAVKQFTHWCATIQAAGLQEDQSWASSLGGRFEIIADDENQPTVSAISDTEYAQLYLKRARDYARKGDLEGAKRSYRLARQHQHNTRMPWALFWRRMIGLRKTQHLQKLKGKARACGPEQGNNDNGHRTDNAMLVNDSAQNNRNFANGTNGTNGKAGNGVYGKDEDRGGLHFIGRDYKQDYWEEVKVAFDKFFRWPYQDSQQFYTAIQEFLSHHKDTGWLMRKGWAKMIRTCCTIHPSMASEAEKEKFYRDIVVLLDMGRNLRLVIRNQVLPGLKDHGLDDLFDGHLALIYDKDSSVSVEYRENVLAVNVAFFLDERQEGAWNALRYNFFYRIVLYWLQNAGQAITTNGKNSPWQYTEDDYFIAESFDARLVPAGKQEVLRDRLNKLAAQKIAFKLSYNKELREAGIRSDIERAMQKHAQGRSQDLVMEVAAIYAMAECAGYPSDDPMLLRLYYALDESQWEECMGLRDAFKRFYRSVDLRNDVRIHIVTREEFDAVNKGCKGAAYYFSRSGDWYIVDPGSPALLDARIAQGAMLESWHDALQDRRRDVDRVLADVRQDAQFRPALVSAARLMGSQMPEKRADDILTPPHGRFDNVLYQEDGRSEFMSFHTPEEFGEKIRVFFANYRPGILRDQWETLKSGIGEQWKALAPSDLDEIKGDYNRLVCAVQVRYGKNHQEAKTDVDRYLKKCIPSKLGVIVFEYLPGLVAGYICRADSPQNDKIKYTSRGAIEEKEDGTYAVVFQASWQWTRSHRRFMRKHGWNPDHYTAEEQEDFRRDFAGVIINDFVYMAQRVIRAGIPANTPTNLIGTDDQGLPYSESGRALGD
ncbi:MAG TPA: hypothetical protein VLJ10_05960, partial [Candidatus Bathyarchaeia archaeon]|nr:hypothetical protein [Candidatus Bathyarchaeia archaeon]